MIPIHLFISLINKVDKSRFDMGEYRIKKYRSWDGADDIAPDHWDTYTVHKARQRRLFRYKRIFHCVHHFNNLLSASYWDPPKAEIREGHNDDIEELYEMLKTQCEMLTVTVLDPKRPGTRGG